VTLLPVRHAVPITVVATSRLLTSVGPPTLSNVEEVRPEQPVGQKHHDGGVAGGDSQEDEDRAENAHLLATVDSWERGHPPAQNGGRVPAFPAVSPLR
jgi:hypothetical protein